MLFWNILRLAVSIVLAFYAGRLVSRVRLPAILGWLITGMILGPHALNLLSSPVLDSRWFGVLEHVFECIFGLMIGTELIWSQLKKAGPQIAVTTLTESLGTFLVVSLVFGLVFQVTGLPLYLAFLFGGIALATAPAPSLSVVRDMQADGPVTRTLIPMAALDDLVGALVFFMVLVVVSARISTQNIPVPLILMLVFLPIVLGILGGVITSRLLRRTNSQNSSVAVMLAMMMVTIGAAFWINSQLPVPMLNFMLLGMAFSAAFANGISSEKLGEIMLVMNPVIGFAAIVVILSLGAPLDYHLIFHAGVYTAIYIVARAVGKYLGAWFGASVTHAPKTVRKYLGLTLLPHSGVSLVFAGIAVSILEGAAPEYAPVIQGTVAAAAVINEIFAVFMAKKGFEWAGELGQTSHYSPSQELTEAV